MLAACHSKLAALSAAVFHSPPFVTPPVVTPNSSSCHVIFPTDRAPPFCYLPPFVSPFCHLPPFVPPFCHPPFVSPFSHPPFVSPFLSTPPFVSPRSPPACCLRQCSPERISPGIKSPCHELPPVFERQRSSPPPTTVPEQPRSNPPCSGLLFTLTRCLLLGTPFHPQSRQGHRWCFRKFGDPD